MRASTPHAVGLSSIDVADQTRFFLHIDRYVPRRHRRYALRLLGSIVPAQRWGIARVRPRGWALYFKGGWGSGTGWADHQVALLRRGRRRLAVAILITSSPSHEYGKETLRGIAARLLRGLRPGFAAALTRLNRRQTDAQHWSVSPPVRPRNRRRQRAQV